MALLLNTNDNVTAINYKYKIPVVSRGKNLFDVNSTTKNGYIMTNGVDIDTDGAAPNNNIAFTDYISVASNSVTISANKNLYNIGYCIYDSNKTLLNRANNYNTKLLTINTTNAKYIRFWFNDTNARTADNKISADDIKQFNIILNEGSTATEYEPYRPPITTPIYLPTPLMANERLTPTSREVKWGKLVLTGSEGWNSETNNRYYRSVLNIKTDGYQSFDTYCSHLPYNLNVYIDAGTQVGFISSKTWIRIRMPQTEEFDTVSEFKAWLKSEYDAGHPVTVWYQLANPTTEAVETNPIGTLRNEEKTIKGTTTIITTDTAVLPTQIEASYKSNKADYVVVNFATTDGNIFTTTDGDTYTIKMRKSQYDTTMTNELLNLLEVM